MAKRANPFIEDFVPQSKIHVGLKQFNNNEDRLHKVYVKTLDLLFKGAKKSTKESVIEYDVVNRNIKPDKMKQLFIGKNGTLSKSGHLVGVKAEAKCKCGSAAELSCAYCEVALCGTCQLNCAQCQGSYCKHCILIGSDSQICFSCYN